MCTQVVAASMAPPRSPTIEMRRSAQWLPGARAPRGQRERLEVAGEGRHLDDGLADHPGLGVGQGGVGGVVGRHVLQEPGGGVEAEPPGGAHVGQPHPPRSLEHPARAPGGARGPTWGRNLSAAEMLEMRLTARSGAWSDARTRAAGSGIDPARGAPHDDHRDAHHGRPAGRRWRAPRRRPRSRPAPAAPPSRPTRRRCTRCPRHPTSTWTQGAIAKPATFMVLDRKNRPTRPLSELSP